MCLFIVSSRDENRLIYFLFTGSFINAFSVSVYEVTKTDKIILKSRFVNVLDVSSLI